MLTYKIVPHIEPLSDSCMTLPDERWDQIAHRIAGDSTSYRAFIAENLHRPEIYHNGRLRSTLPGGLVLRCPARKRPEQNSSEATLPPWRRSL